MVVHVELFFIHSYIYYCAEQKQQEQISPHKCRKNAVRDSVGTNYFAFWTEKSSR